MQFCIALHYQRARTMMLDIAGGILIAAALVGIVGAAQTHSALRAQHLLSEWT